MTATRRADTVTVLALSTARISSRLFSRTTSMADPLLVHGQELLEIHKTLAQREDDLRHLAGFAAGLAEIPNPLLEDAVLGFGLLLLNI